MKFKDLREEKKLESIQEGTWKVPETANELMKLSEMLYMPYPAKTRRKVIQFQKEIPMGDDHMYDVLDDVGMTDERRLQKWDEPVYINVLAGQALEEEGWITGRVTNNGRSYDTKTHGFGELSELPQTKEMALLKRKKGNLKPSRKMLKLERVSGGKLDPLSKMGKSKLTGQEIAQYYRKNPKAKQAARDPMVKKAIELALDLGGNQTLAVKEIEKMKRGLSKNSAVASALRTANEDMTSTSSVAMPDGIPLGKVKKRKELEEGVGTITIDFSKAPNPKRAKEKTIDIAKRYMIKVGKPKKPQSKDDVAFTGSKQAMKLFGKEFNLAGKTGLLEGKAVNKKAQIEKIKFMRKVKATTKGQKIALGDLLAMTSPKVLEGMFKRNPRGFMAMLDKMNPKRDKLTKADYVVDGQFVSDRGVLSKDQTKQLDKDLERLTGLNEETILYRVKDIQKPELDKFKSSARLMKLKINIKQSPRGKETIIRLEGGKKQIRDFDAVARGKSSYGDPSIVEDAVERAKELADLKAKHKREVEQEKDEIERTKQSAETESILAQLDALEEQIDLIEQSLLVERQFRLNPNKKSSLWKQWFSKKNQKDKRTKNMAKSMYSPEDVIEYHFNAGNLKPGKNIVKDTGASVLARSLGKIMNDERKKARDKGAAFGKGDPVDEMDAPRIKKIIDTIAKGLIINVNRKGDDSLTFTYDKTQGDLFYDLDTYTRDIVWDIMQMGSDGTFYQAVYGEPEGRKLNLKFPKDYETQRSGKVKLSAQTESFNLNEESQTMKKVRQVIKKKSMMNVDGTKLDLTTASMIASVYDKVNPTNKKRMDSLKLPQLINLTMKVAGKARKESTDLQEMHPKSMDAMKRLNKRTPDALKDQMPTIGWDAGKQMYRVVMLSKKTGKPVRTSHIPVSREFPAPKDKNKINAKELGKAMKTLEKKIGMKIGVDESTDLPFSLSILERMSGIQNKSTDFIKVPKLTSIEQGRMTKIKKRFPKLPEPVVYEIMRLTHKGNKVDSRKFVEIGNLYDKDYKGGTGGKFIQKLRNMGARLPQGHMGEAVSPAQQAAIAISKKERGEKPKDKTDECADEKDFKPHMMYDPKTGKGVMANKYADHVKYDKMGYTHEKPKSEALDAKDKPFVKDLISKLRGGSKTHAKQADDLEKAMKTENRAKRDAMKDMGKNDDKEDDGYGTATDDDRKAADKNVIMQIRRVADLPKGGQIELPNGKKVKMDRKSAIALNKKFDSIRKPQDKLKLQKMMNDKKISVVALKRLLGK